MKRSEWLGAVFYDFRLHVQLLQHMSKKAWVWISLVTNNQNSEVFERSLERQLIEPGRRVLLRNFPAKDLENQLSPIKEVKNKITTHAAS